MAEAPESEPVPSSSENIAVCEVKDEEEPLTKKRKIDKETSDKLEHRLGGILCCAVCLDLPSAAVYQCTNGHLMCANCFTHLLADARIRDETATCPNCRIEISKTSATRNLAVEKTVSELPADCKYCNEVFPRHSIQHHEESTCENSSDGEYKLVQVSLEWSPQRTYLGSLVRIASRMFTLLATTLGSYIPTEAPAKRPYHHRPSGCRFECLGCPWRGPAHAAGGHEARCARPALPAADALPAIAARHALTLEARVLHEHLLELLSYDKISFNDLQLKPYRTEEYVHKLYYETSRFSAFGHQWVVKAFVNKNQRDPTQSSIREITYQLILKSKPLCPVWLQWAWLRGPGGAAALRPTVAAHHFGEAAPDAPPLPLPLADPAAADRLLAHRAIHCRLFLASK